jgi:eukaryotic-like serine/threonine-protein kinase
MTMVQSARVARERDRAEQALARAEAVNGFLVGMFREADPRFALGKALTAQEMLQRASVRLQTELQSQPAARAELLLSLGGVYKQLGRYDEAEPMHEQAVALLRTQGLPQALAEVLDQLGDVRRLKGDLEGALVPLQEALELRRQTLGTRHHDYAESLNNLGLVLYAQGRYADAERMHREGVATWETLAATEDGDDLIALGLTNLGRAVLAQGRASEAQSLFERGLQLRRARLAATNPRIGTSLFVLAQARRAQGDVAGATTHAEASIRIREQALGADHPQTSLSRMLLAQLQADADQWAQARETAETTLRLARANPNSGPAVLADAEVLLGEAAWRSGRVDAARAHLTRAREHAARTSIHVPATQQGIARLAARLAESR